MLKFFRNKLVLKRIFWTLLILTLPAFLALESGNISRWGKKLPYYIGTVNDQEISFDELSRNMNGIKGQLILNYFNQPETVSGLFDNKPFLAKLAWERLVLLREAKTHNIKIADKEVIDYMRKHPMFGRDGFFDPKIYEQTLKYVFGLDPRTFEETVRENLIIQKLKDIISKDIRVSEDEILRAYNRDNEKMKISYVLIPDRDFLDKTNIGDNEIRNYYENHKLEFILSRPKKDGYSTVPEFEEVKDSIHASLAKNISRRAAFRYAEDIYRKLLEMSEKDKIAFDVAAAELGLKVEVTPMFSKLDNIEGIGRADYLIEAALTLKNPDQISYPVETEKGIIIFRILETGGIDKDKFKKEKESYYNMVLEAKKFNELNERFKKISPKTRLKIDFQDIEKYY